MFAIKYEYTFILRGYRDNNKEATSIILILDSHKLAFYFL